MLSVIDHIHHVYTIAINFSRSCLLEQLLFHDGNSFLMLESSPPSSVGSWLSLASPPGLLGYATPPGGILKPPSYQAPLISAMLDVGGLVLRGVCL